MSSKKIAVNNYVYCKINEDWLEARVVIIHPNQKDDGTKDAYRKFTVHLLSTYSIYPEPIPSPNVHLSSIENYKKYKISSLRHLLRNIHIPPTLMNYLQKDVNEKIVTSLPARFSVNEIIYLFKQFMSVNKATVIEGELIEMVNGFIYYFNIAIKYCLLYKNEIDQYNNITEQPSSVYGAKHLLRLIYLIQSKYVSECNNTELKDILYEYSVYLLDYLDLKYKEYFDE
ncbi:Protein MRG1 [Astathelohania contejeani]|uniref:Protein MRG1 n=1 Tax=Astathelohania contejeani TaxID=164912 RepID=A0ABQ7I055_9MICR|nr:Protein MRG1 [Thelohania contejeani]